MTEISGGRILLVGAGFDTRSTLRAVLVAAGFELVDAASDEEALDRTATQDPLGVLIDLDDPSTSGYLVCKLLRERHGEMLPIVLVSGSKVESSDRVVGLLIGADDYMTKPLDPGEVIARIRRLVARSAAREGAVTRTVQASPIEPNVDDFDLTARERQVMALLLDGLTQAEIARELVISSNTVATHIQRILLKLGVHNRAQAVAKVARAGWLRRDGSGDSIVEVLADAAAMSKAHDRPL
jgi:DNA-binding NarL/FixJ family response regulator